MQNVPPEVLAFMQNFLGDKRNIIYPEGNLLMQEIALDNAMQGKEFQLHGDFLYADSDSTGIVYVQFNNTALPGFPFRKNTSVSGFPYKTAYVSWDAQPGDIIRLWYGYGARIIPPNQDIIQILSTVDIQPVGLTPTNTVKAVTNASQVLLLATTSALRRKLIIQNQDAGNDLYLMFAAAPAVADATCLKIEAGGTLEMDNPPISEIRGIMSGASAGNNVFISELS